MSSIRFFHCCHIIQDSFRLFIVFLVLSVIYCSYLFSSSIASKPNAGLDIVFFCMFVPCLLVFSSWSLLALYVSYEFSLLTIIYIIVKWGSYPDRSLRALMLLIYTSVFSMPLMAGLFYIYSVNLTFACFYVCINSVLSSSSILLSFVIFLSFGVKLPVYGLHYWLPMAHVEAPTFGSMILAGVLLKLGGAGLIRFFNFLDLEGLAYTLTRYLLFFLVLSTLICCFQSDFKRMVAYSSVSHMIAVPLVLLTGFFVGFKVVVLLIFFHGLRSPILFSLVGVLYSIYSTRQLALLRGLLLLSPLLSFACIFSFLFTLSAPPYASFFSEVFFFVYVVFLSPMSLRFLLLFAFLSLVYNLNWLSRLLFRKLYYRVSSRCSLVNFSYLLPLVYFHGLSFLMLFLVSAV